MCRCHTLLTHLAYVLMALPCSSFLSTQQNIPEQLPPTNSWAFSFWLQYSHNPERFPSKSGTTPTLPLCNADPHYYPDYFLSYSSKTTLTLLLHMSISLALRLSPIILFLWNALSLDSSSPSSLHAKSYLSLSSLKAVPFVKFFTSAQENESLSLLNFLVTASLPLFLFTLIWYYC